MITREEVLKSEDYWFEYYQGELYDLLEAYMDKHEISPTEMSLKLQCNRFDILEILNGDFNGSMLDLIRLSLAMGKKPIFKFEEL